MNWGNRIVVAFICFAGFIGYMVFRAFQEDFDLVTEDYYAQEIKYQQKLERLSNASEVDEIQVQQSEKDILLRFPERATGEIHFYHPSRKMFDKVYEISLDADQTQTIDKEDLVPGSYRINISWKADGKEFLQQNKIYLR